MIRIGILGAAKIGPKAIIEPAAKRDDCEIVAVAARDADKARTYAEANGIAHVETDYDALVHRKDVDLIYNALPPHRHADGKKHRQAEDRRQEQEDHVPGR